MRVAVLAGGRSGEHEVSLSSGASVREGVAQAGHEVVDVRLARDGGWSCEGEAVRLEPGRGLLGCDAAWPVLHGPYGEDGTVQGLLELLGVPYVGSGVLASALCMDKILFKDVLAAAGVPQVDYVAVRRGEDADLERLGYPLFVKPARLGSSVGIVKVRDASELEPALEEAFAHDDLLIAEAFSGGLEVEAAVLGDRVSAPGEIVLHGSEWYDYEAKYTPGAMELQVPARISAEATAEVQRLALETFQRMGCRGLARADFFVEDDRVLVNELNTMPGFTQTSVYPKLWSLSGISFPELCDRLLALT